MSDGENRALVEPRELTMLRGTPLYFDLFDSGEWDGFARRVLGHAPLEAHDAEILAELKEQDQRLRKSE